MAKEFEKGKVVIVIGGSGAGKTSLLNELATYENFVIAEKYSTRERRDDGDDIKSVNILPTDKGWFHYDANGDTNAINIKEIYDTSNNGTHIGIALNDIPAIEKIIDVCKDVVKIVAVKNINNSPIPADRTNIELREKKASEINDIIENAEILRYALGYDMYKNIKNPHGIRESDLLSNECAIYNVAKIGLEKLEKLDLHKKIAPNLIVEVDEAAPFNTKPNGLAMRVKFELGLSSQKIEKQSESMR